MRKVLSLVLALSLVLGSFSAVFAASGSKFSDVEGTKYEDAVNVLFDLNVVSGYDENTYKPEGIINRAEMAVLIVRAMGMEKSVTNDTSSFTDMTGYGWAEGYVAFAQGMGFVNGYGDGTFRPGNTVSYNEAATMLVGALGYTTNSLNGTYPANFVSQALSLGILKDIQASAEGANRGDVAIMVYQTLNAKIGSTNSDGNWVPNTGGDTMLKRLGAEEANDGDFFVLKDSDADVSVINTRPYVGAYVKAFVNSDDEIITISEVKSQFLSGKLNSDGNFKADGVEYNVATSVKSATTAVFTNGVYKGEGYLYKETKEDKDTIKSGVGVDEKGEKFVKVTIAADVTGKTIKTIYSINDWDVQSSLQVEAGDLTDLKDGEIAGYDFPEDYYGEVDYTKFELLGVNSLEDIKEDNVVYIYADNSKVITRLEVGTETVTGTVSRIRDESDLTISGTVYELSAVHNSINDVEEKPSTGDAVTLYLDYAGDYYEIKVADGSAGNYAVIVALNDGGFNNPQIRLYLADGTSKTFDVDYEASNTKDFFNGQNWNTATVTVDGKEVMDVDTSELNTKKISVGDIVKYGVNNSGDITNIKKQVVTDNNATALEKLYVKDAEVTKRGILTGAGTLANNVVIFTVDTTGGLNKTLSSITTSKLGVTSYDKVLGIKNVDAKFVTDNGKVVAVVMDGKASADDDVFGVITNVDLVDNNAGGEVTLFVNGAKKTFEADDDLVKDILNKENAKHAALSQLVRLTFDTAGVVTNVEFIDKDTTYKTNDKVKVLVDTDKNDSGVDFETGSKNITLNGLNRVVDSPSFIYEFDGKDWKSMGNLSSLDRNTYKEVIIFDCVDEDGVADTIVVVK